MTNPDLTRRTVLGALGSGTAAAALAACGHDSKASASAGTGSAGGSSDEKGSGGTGLVATADVPIGSGVILKDQKVVVTQPAKGTFLAFSAVCTHLGCTVATISGDQILCPCHGSVFSVKDGSVLGGPAPSPLPPVQVSVEGGQVVES
jgi:Rieske Fe-S protein